MCLGCYWRDFPTQSSCPWSFDDNSFELALELGDRLLDPIPRQSRPRQCKPGVQGVFHLGRLLLDLYRLRLVLYLRMYLPFHLLLSGH